MGIVTFTKSFDCDVNTIFCPSDDMNGKLLSPFLGLGYLEAMLGVEVMVDCNIWGDGVVVLVLRASDSVSKDWLIDGCTVFNSEVEVTDCEQPIKVNKKIMNIKVFKKYL